VSVSSVSVDQCLRAARAGSSDALGEILQAYRQYLLKIANEEIDRALQAKGGASDLVQETFLEAARDFSHFHGGSAAELRAWLRCMLLRHVAKQGRRFRKTSKRRLDRECSLEAFLSSAGDGASLLSGHQTPSQDAVAEEELDLLRQALEQLTGDYRSIMQLRYQEGRTFEEIGSLMGRSANAVRLLWLRAVERVKHALEIEVDG
jgi:RNA polymerase sigma-70 factor (ECF subfamily)